MAKFIVFFAVAALVLLASSELTSAARPAPNSELETVQHDQSVMADQSLEDGEVRCEGLNEEECLMRRTLNAHVDYIYTQKHKP